MDKTINNKPKIKYSVRLKFVTTFFAFIALLLILLNTYPLMVSRDLVFTSKQKTLQSQAMVISSSLSALETLTVGDVEKVMELLDIMPLTRVIVTDNTGKVLYDTSNVDTAVGRYALFSEISRALSGDVVFFSRFADGAFMSRTAMPVVSHSTIIGSIYLYEYDKQQGEIIIGIQSRLGSISFVVSALSLLLVLFLTNALTRRITEIVRAVRIVSEGEYSYRMPVKGNDELAELSWEFNALTDRLENTEELRRRFVSDASHELKTPLAAIRLLGDSIVQSDNMDEDTMREFVADIGNEAERLRRITEKLLALTRLDEGKQAERSAVDVKKVVESTMHLLAPLAEKWNVKLEKNLSDNCFIYAAEDDIYQVVFNLAENGIKYNLPGGTVRILLYTAEDKVFLIVDDTGIGIPEEDRPYVFSRFYRVDKARSREAGGSGLGLSIVHDAVRFHGGTVEIQSREAGGTRFRVCFPLYKPGEEQEK
ncbi:MAG TPA: HAMP domain-containing histidine kinase [Clostridiales bacterium]|nr:HAMP domain-containing histidine kinase [Clostridiales bacterium]